MEAGVEGARLPRRRAGLLLPVVMLVPRGAGGRPSRLCSRPLFVSLLAHRAPALLGRPPGWHVSTSDSWLPGSKPGQRVEARIPRKCYDVYTPEPLHCPRVGQAGLGKSGPTDRSTRGDGGLGEREDLAGTKTERRKAPWMPPRLACPEGRKSGGAKPRTAEHI